MKAWLLIYALGLLKWPFKALALVVVPFLSDYQRVHHPIWGVRDAKQKGDTSWNWIAWRNGVHNMTTRATPHFDTWSNSDDWTLEFEPGFQWRYRRSKCGLYHSFRMTWGPVRSDKGKREFYIGWTMNEEVVMRLTFFQCRPAWLLPVALPIVLSPVAAIAYGIVWIIGWLV